MTKIEEMVSEHSKFVENWAIEMIKKHNLPSSAEDTLWVFNRESFCYMIGSNAKHSETCTCDDAYDGVAQDG